MWKFLVKNQSIEVLEREVLADHQIQYVQFRFIFEGDWKHFHKVVQFTQGEDTYNIVLEFDGTSCYLPAELHVGAVKMSLFGYDAESDTTVRATTVPVTLNIRASGFVGDDDLPIPPTPDLYVQLLKQIKQANTGTAGQSAYELAVQEGFTGNLSEWLQSLHGRDGVDGKNGTDGRDGIDGKDGRDGTDGKDGTNGCDGIDGNDGRDGVDGKDGVSPDISEITAIIQQVIGELPDQSHIHSNKEILDSITESMLETINGFGTFEGWTREQIQSLIYLLSQYKSSTDNSIQSINDRIIDSENMNHTLEALQAQIDNLRLSDSSVTIFKSGNDALYNYGELIYTFYVDGYRSLSGFASTYHNFCCADNDHAISYNQPDFNWGAEIYTMCITPVRMNANSRILFSYKCGFNQCGEMWLVRKSPNELSAAETARYIHEQIIYGGAVFIPFNWLHSPDIYITVLLSSENLPADDYYLAWKAITDNTHPQIRQIKILEVT